MTTTVTTAASGPMTANGVTPIPFTFQAVSGTEIEVTRNGIVASPTTYFVNLAPDGTGSITPTTSWGSDTVWIYSDPEYMQTTEFQRHGAFYPDQINNPLDRLARATLGLRGYVDRVLQDLQNTAGLSLALAASTGSQLVGFIQSGTGAVARTVYSKFRSLPLHVSDFATLQQAVNAAAAQGKALDLGSDDFTVTSTIILPDADIVIRGSGSAALRITYTGSGDMFSAVGLGATTSIEISGFTAIATGLIAGRPISLHYAPGGNQDFRSVFIDDVVAYGTIVDYPTRYWGGGIKLENCRTAIISNCVVHGPTGNLAKTIDGINLTGDSTDCRIAHCVIASVGTAIDISGQVEGTIITGLDVVDVNIGVRKVHVGTSEPWVSMSDWHINARQKGFEFDNVLQVTINKGLLYAQNATGDWIGCHIKGGAVFNNDYMLDFMIDAQLAGGGATSTTGLKVDVGNGVTGTLKMRGCTNGINLASGVSNCVLTVIAEEVTNPIIGTGSASAGNKITWPSPTNGLLLPQSAGPYNPDRGSGLKSMQSFFFGTDTAGAIKASGGIRVIGRDNNFVSARVELYGRNADALTRYFELGEKHIYFEQIWGMNYASDAAAAAAGIPVGGLYHNAGAARIRLA